MKRQFIYIPAVFKFSESASGSDKEGKTRIFKQKQYKCRIHHTARWALGVAFSACLTHCVSVHPNKKITAIPFQSSKFDTMRKLGSPFQIKRKHGLDYWIYKFKAGKKEYIRQVIFKDGRLIRKGKPSPWPVPVLILDGVKDIEEYEQAVEQYREQKTQFDKPPEKGQAP